MPPLYFIRRFKFLSNTHVAVECCIRASLHDQYVPFPPANSGKRTFAYSAATIFDISLAQTSSSVNSKFYRPSSPP